VAGLSLPCGRKEKLSFSASSGKRASRVLLPCFFSMLPQARNNLHLAFLGKKIFFSWFLGQKKFDRNLHFLFLQTRNLLFLTFAS
jgi:hypothetical protein